MASGQPVILASAPQGTEIIKGLQQREASIKHQQELAKQRAEHAARAAALAAQQQAEAAAQEQQAQTYTAPAPEPAPSSNCGDNQYANFIYMHESGCSLNNPNPTSGACGIGQAWPCSKLLAVCPNMDYACENRFFTNYAISTYGSWENAYRVWISKSWW